MGAVVEEQITTEKAMVELARYLQIAADRADRGRSTPMFSPYIDAVWHDALTNPATYAEFSLQHIGEVLDHRHDEGRGVVPWVADYEQRFGSPLPAAWFAGEDGTLDDEALAAYRTTGEIVASWRCRPSRPPQGR